MDEMHKLVEQLNLHSYNYYVLDNPTISDAEYDILYDKLVKLEKNTGIVLQNSPTARVGDVVLEGFKKHTHKVRLYSLNKCKSHSELTIWLADIKKSVPNASFSLEYKFDGLTIVCYYNHGELISAATRGNGLIGEDVTAQVKTIRTVPLSIPFMGELIVQGEGMMKLSNLKKYNEANSEQLKNARNAVAGAIRNLNPKETAKRNLDWFCYDICYIKEKKFASQSEVHDFLIENKFNVEPYFKILNNAQEITQEIEQVAKYKDNLNILMDGMVIKLNQVPDRDEFGYTSKFPKWAIAFKFEPEEITSKVSDVIWQVGRTGKITPIAIVEPVELAGATVTRATLNNFGDIQRKKVEIGSRVFIRRSNEVIPEILGLAEKLQNSKKIHKPTICPCCHTELKEIGANLFCLNYFNCQGQISERITHFAGRDAMNIEGLSNKTVNALIKAFNVKNASDIYSIKKSDLLTLPNFKDKKAENIMSAIEKSKNTTMDKFIFALGIQNVGKKTAKDLSKYFGTIESLKNATVEQLNSIREIGEIMAKSIYDYFSNPHSLQLIEDLINKGVIIKETENVLTGKLSGKTFVLTGGLLTLTRQEATNLIEKHGGQVSSSVSKNTNFVVVGQDAGSKLEKAKKLNLYILSEEDFKSMINL